MTGVRLDIDLNDLPALHGAMLGLIAAGADTQALMTDVARYGEVSTKQRFEDQVGPDGAPWQPSRRAATTGGQTLVDRGHLRDSYSSEATVTDAVWGTNLIYAPTHQFGATIRPKTAKRLAFVIPGLGFRSALEVTIPARPMVGINDDDIAKIGDLIGGHFFDGWDA